MWRDSDVLEGGLWIFSLALAAFLAFGFASCQDKGLGPASEDWQAMYEALSEEQKAKLGDGLKSVATSGLSKETIVDSEFDSTYAIDTSGAQVLFYIRARIDTSSIPNEVEELGLVLEYEGSDPAYIVFHTKATFSQIIALAKVETVGHIEAETDWRVDFRALSEEESRKLGPSIGLIGNSNITEEELGGSIFAERWAIDTKGEEPLFGILVTIDGSTKGIEELGLKLRPAGGNMFSTKASFPQIIVLAKLENIIRVELVPKAHPLKPRLRR